MSSFNLYAKYFLKIKSKNGELNPFIQSAEQRYISYLLYRQKKEDQRVRALIIKGRQVGITTLIAARIFYNISTNKYINGLSISNKMASTANMYNIMARYYNNLPSLVKPKGVLNKHKAIHLTELDSICNFSTAKGDEVGRSDTLQFIHGSEVAFWDNPNILASLLPAVPDTPNTEVILESTSNGTSGLFYEMCIENLKKQNNKTRGYQVIFIPWYWHKNYALNQDQCSDTLSSEWQEYGKKYNLTSYQLNWAYSKNAILANNKNEPSLIFCKEYPASIYDAFKYSNSNIFINYEDIQAQIVAGANKDKIKDLMQKNANSPMILGVDVATTGNDSSYVIDRKGNLLGFNVNENIKGCNTMELVGKITQYIKMYNPDVVCIDAGGGGVGVYDRLKELGYNKIIKLVYFGSKAFSNHKYVNKRAEMWGDLKDFLSCSYNCIVEDKSLLSQICCVQYFYTSEGKIQLEKKENIKKRIKQSPDGADAAVLTFACAKSINNKDVKLIYNEDCIKTYDPFLW